MSAPPVPVRLGDRPTVGGLVVPWISLETDRGHHLGQVSQVRWQVCIHWQRCQTCGQRLDHKYVVVARVSDRERGYVAEPAMHPECAAYSAKACPMLAGAMDHYRTHPQDMSQRTCPDPECQCALIPAGDTDARAGAPAERFFSVWARWDDYRPAEDTDGSLLGLAWPQMPLRMRPLGENDRPALALMRGETPCPRDYRRQPNAGGR